MPHKKIVFIIVEGPSDEEALGVILNRIFDSKAVHVEVMHCDITSEIHVNSKNIVSKIGNVIKRYAGSIFKSKDFDRIIHIIDTDGAFVSNNAILEDDSAIKPIYSETEIRTQNKKSIESRNLQKRECINRLSSTHYIWKIPYQIYYMSCNLDHLLYGKLNITNCEKQKYAFEFAKKYRDNIPEFKNYICNSEFSVTKDYFESWQYIKKELHSLERHTNFGICFSTDKDNSQTTP